MKSYRGCSSRHDDRDRSRSDGDRYRDNHGSGCRYVRRVFRSSGILGQYDGRSSGYRDHRPNDGRPSGHQERHQRLTSPHITTAASSRALIGALARAPQASHAALKATCKSLKLALQSRDFENERVACGCGPEICIAQADSSRAMVDATMRWFLAFPSFAGMENCRIELQSAYDSRNYTFAQIRVGGAQIPAVAMNKDFGFEQLYPMSASKRLRDAWWLVAQSIFEGAPLPHGVKILAIGERRDASSCFRAIVCTRSECALLKTDMNQDWEHSKRTRIVIWGGLSEQWLEGALWSLVLQRPRRTTTFQVLGNKLQHMVFTEPQCSWDERWEGDHIQRHGEVLSPLEYGENATWPFGEQSLAKDDSTDFPQSAEHELIQEVDHEDEVAAQRDVEMCRLQADMEWADNVENFIRVGAANDCTESHAWNGENIWFYPFQRAPMEFLDTLLEGPELEHIRQELQDHRYELIYKGAKIFVWPEQYPTVICALNERGIELKTSHVVVSESLLPNLEACIQHIPSRRNVRVKPRERFVLTIGSVGPGLSPMASSKEEGSNNQVEVPSDWEELLSVERTFLCFAKPLRKACSVTQSTTEHYKVNPRRIIPSSP